jgi:hypothetical protein
VLEDTQKAVDEGLEDEALAEVFVANCDVDLPDGILVVDVCRDDRHFDAFFMKIIILFERFPLERNDIF